MRERTTYPGRGVRGGGKAVEREHFLRHQSLNALRGGFVTSVECADCFCFVTCAIVVVVVPLLPVEIVILPIANRMPLVLTTRIAQAPRSSLSASQLERFWRLGLLRCCFLLRRRLPVAPKRAVLRSGRERSSVFPSSEDDFSRGFRSGIEEIRLHEHRLL